MSVSYSAVRRDWDFRTMAKWLQIDMLKGLLRMERGDQIIPFVRMFYGGPSTCLWEDETGTTLDIPQGEQGDPLMPLFLVRTWLAQGTHSGPRKVVAEREGVRFP